HLPFVSLIATFGVFALSFIMRPIGGAIMGHYADYAGRRKVLILSMTIMTLATTAIAFLPGFNTLGIASPILFTLLRLMQGMAVGGELPGSTAFLIEHTFTKYRGFAGSLVLCTGFLGIFLGSLTAAILSASFSYEYLLDWGWRFAYGIGGVLGIVGIYLRMKSKETSAFLKASVSGELPAKLVFTKYRWELFLSVIFTSILALGNYVLIAYVTTFLVKDQGFSLSDALMINLLALFLLTALIPLFGYCSDLYGRKSMLFLGLAGMFLFIFPCFFLFLSGNWWYCLWGELLLSVVLAPINATVPTVIAELFPTTVRASGISIGYNLGQAFFGGTLPLVALTLIEITGNLLAPAWYVFLFNVVVLITWLFLKETYKLVLE
ncbi:MAG: MFS transporter, partial [Legionella sp.]